MAHSGKTMTFATDLVPQEDNIYRLGYSNQRWKIYGDLQPLATKIYNAPLYNTSSGANFYQNFATVIPVDYNALWIAHYRITITAEGHSDYTEICDVSISGRANTYYTYKIYNSIVTYSIYQHMLLNSNSTSNNQHELGYRMQGSYGADSVAKVVKVELLEQLNCIVTLLDNLKLYTSATPSGYTWRGFNATSNGLQEAGDTNDIGYYILSNGFKGKAGSNKVYRYCLFARTGDGTYESFVMQDNTVATTKTVNPHGFVPDGKIYWNANNTVYSEGTLNLSPYQQYHALDYRYSFNFNNTFLPDYCETYVVYTYNEDDGLLYLDTTQWLAAALPTTADGKIYQRIGSKYYTGTSNYYQGSLLLENPYYEYKDGDIRSWSATHLSNITGADDLKAIEAISGTSGLLKKTAANTWTLDTNSYVTSSGITSVTIGATSPVQSSTSTAQTGSSASTTISLKDAYGDTKNPYGTKAKNLVLAGPASGNNAAPTFRALVAADIPSLAYVPATGGVNDVNTLVNTGIYNITSGSATNTPKGYGFGQLLVMSYRKHKDNTTTDWASQLYLHNGGGTASGSASAPGNVLYYRTSNSASSNTWFDWQKTVHVDDTYTKVGDTNKPVYIAADGTATPISYEINKSVPSDAVFTDHYAWGDITSKPDTATRWPKWNEINQSGAENLSVGNSDVGDKTEILTSYASDDGFSDTHGKGVVYRREAIHIYNYIKGKTDLLYVAKSAGVTNVAWDSTNKKITKTINGTTSDVVTAATLKDAINVTAADLGLSKAMRFIGVAANTITDGGTQDPGISGYSTKTAGDVIIDSASSREYVWSTTGKWELLGGDSSYKTTQTAVTDPTASTSTSTTFIDTISQDANGVITATKKTLPKYAGSSSAGGAATNAATTANTTDTLYLVGVKSGATSTLLHDTSITVKGNTLDAGIIKLHQGTAADPSLTGNARIEFDYGSGQPVVISYTPNDSYRTPAGLKIMGGSGATPAWLEVEGNMYAAAFKGNADTATSAGKWTTARTLTIGSTGKSVDGSGNVSWTLAEIGAAATEHGTHVTTATVQSALGISSSGSSSKALTEKGTFVAFGTSNLTIGTTSTTAMAGNTTVTNVAISANITTNADYPIVFATSNKDTTAAKNEGLQKSGAKFYFNPSTGNVQATTFNGYTLAAASAKGVVTTIDTSANLPTSNAVKTFVEGKGYVTSSGVTSVATGVGLTGGTITGTGTIKAKLKSETAHTADSVTPTNTANRQYAVGVDKSGYLSVNVPWIDNNTDTKVSQSVTTTANWRKVLLHHKDDTSSTAAETDQTDVVYGAQYISAQPSTGTLRANAYRVTDNVTLQWNDTDQSLDFIFA